MLYKSTFGGSDMKRRHFLQTTTAGALAVSPVAFLLADSGELQRTPRDYEGPYYPVGPRNHTNNLILGKPRDRTLNLNGRVLSPDGSPYPVVRVEIWQTDTLGRYKHPRDASDGERWSDFLYWGEAVTDDDGRFDFRTYVPGAYGRRPSHIHYKVWQDERRLLTSQVYFHETGGTQGASRDPSRSELQTIALEPERDGLVSFLRVVI